MGGLYPWCFRPMGSQDAQHDHALEAWFQQLSHLELDNFEIDDVEYNPAQFEAAQRELICMDAHRAPRDKMSCILRCCAAVTRVVGRSTSKSNSGW